MKKKVNFSFELNVMLFVNVYYLNKYIVTDKYYINLMCQMLKVITEINLKTLYKVYRYFDNTII